MVAKNEIKKANGIFFGLTHMGLIVLENNFNDNGRGLQGSRIQELVKSTGLQRGMGHMHALHDVRYSCMGGRDTFTGRYFPITGAELGKIHPPLAISLRSQWLSM